MIGLYYVFDELIVDLSQNMYDKNEMENEMNDILEYLNKYCDKKKTSGGNGVALVTGTEGTIGREIFNFEEHNNERQLLFKNNHLVTYINCDMKNLKNVKDACNSIKKMIDSLDLIICNAGVMCIDNKKNFNNNNDNKIEKFYQSIIENHSLINFISHVGIVNEMKKLLKKSSFPQGGKVVFISSSTCHAGKIPTLKEINEGTFLTQYLNGYQAYANSKLYLSMYSLYLHNFSHTKDGNKLTDYKSNEKCECRDINKRKIQYLSLHPGVVAGDLYKHVNFIFQYAICNILKVILRSPVVAAYYITEISLNPIFKLEGRYFENNYPVKIKGLLETPNLIEKFGRKVDDVLEDIGFNFS
ncbi:Glucose/ribitol dehydrogenase family and NAD(P)-binding domain-containing protein [Strongyloides ratti]|uniref:Glucose/ribitol dehydrogenase family and NAD(P)-binding domain-containing protein n=1 Tax=Strongyloides ratti TaxID=34506 RepID=A0A090LJZ5_STRRB|nr:Glucose/ribitol dehydrogenase family and NAD(P)-binding domain-containing protein [Strongyloides ratti]CEF70117.1 Glucose/ribitol dehydrogenase family and NAD(P)-binding domain-containing protein [Strongyloides ratti]